MQFYKYISLYIVSGILLGVGFLWPVFWFAGVLGITLHLYTLSQKKEWRIRGSFLAWTIKFLFVLGFYWSMYPIKWLPFDFGAGEFWLIGLYWLTVALFLGTSGAVFGILYSIVSSAATYTKWFWYLGIPFVWVIAEVAGSLLLSVFTYGPGAVINTYFSLGYVGLLIAEHGILIELARVGGVYALSFTAVLIVVLAQRMYASHNSVMFKVALGVVCFLMVLTAHMTVANEVTTEQTMTVAVVETSFPVHELFNRDRLPDLQAMQSEALDVAIKTGAGVIVLPEDARFFDHQNIEFSQQFLSFKYSDFEGIIIDSSRVSYGDRSVLQGLYLDQSSDQYHTVHKRYLVPQGEFVPYVYSVFFRLIGQGYLIDELSELVSYTIGDKTSQANLPQYYPGLLFCFESASATGVYDLVNERPGLPFIAHPVSHSWFNEPQSFWSQLDIALRVQALWNDVSVVTAANHAPSKLFLPNGAVETLEVKDQGTFWKVGTFEVPVQ